MWFRFSVFKHIGNKIYVYNLKTNQPTNNNKNREKGEEYATTGRIITGCDDLGVDVSLK